MTKALIRPLVCGKLIGLGLLALPVPVFAVTYSINIVSTAGSLTVSTPGMQTFSASFCTSGLACGSISATTDNGPAGGGFASATLTLSGVTMPAADHAYMSTADTFTEYSIAVNGPLSVEVPVDIASLITESATATPDGSVGAGGSITVTNRQGQQVYYKTCSAALGCRDVSPGGTMFPGFSAPVTAGGFTGPAVLLGGFSYDVILEADTIAEANGTATATVDPTFTVEPAYASQFSITGVPSAAATAPEPASWALMVAGFGCVGWATRRLRARRDLPRSVRGRRASDSMVKSWHRTGSCRP